MTRQRLPNRRDNILRNFTFEGRRFTICAGLDPLTGEVREAFLNGDQTKVGSHEEFILEDASVLISLALQNGIPIERMRHSLGRDGRGNPATVIGAALATLSDIQAEIAGTEGLIPA